MVKLMGSKEKRKLSKKLNFAEIGGETHKCCENKLRGKFMNFVEIGENMQFTSLAWGDGRPLIAVANLEGCTGLSMSIGSVERIVDYRFIASSSIVAYVCLLRCSDFDSFRIR